MSTTELATRLQTLLGDLPGLRSATLLQPGEDLTLASDGTQTEDALHSGAHAVRELLENTRHFRLNTHWLRLAGTQGTLYALAEEAVGVLVLVTAGPRLEADSLDQLHACLQEAA